MKKAVIYTRGHNEEMQEILCRMYASDKGYKVLYVTSNLNDVNLCDVMLVTNPSRISRDEKEYYEIVNQFKARGIETELAIDDDKFDDNFFLAKHLIK